MMLSFFLAADMIYSIKNPFYPKFYRVIKSYLPITAAIGLVTYTGLFIEDFYSGNEVIDGNIEDQILDENISNVARIYSNVEAW